MPCKFCRDHSHALNNCNSPRLQEFGEYMTAVLANHTYDFVSQMRELSRLTASYLAGLCKYLNVRNTGSKAVLITAIIAQRFTANVNSHDSDNVVDQKIMDLLFCAEYSYLINPLTRVGTLDLNMGTYMYVCDKLLQMMDLHINARYCVVREEADNSWTLRGKVACVPLDFNSHQNALDRARLNQASFMLRRQMSNKLTIKIEESAEEDAVEECGICYDVKTVAALNCGHSFCTDCVYKTALSRKGAHICCAFCRAQVQTISLKEGKSDFESIMNAA